MQNESDIIYPENQELFIKFQSIENSLEQLKISIYGIGGILDVIYDIQKNENSAALLKKRDSIPAGLAKDNTVIVPFGIKIIFSDRNVDLSQLDKIFKSNNLINKTISEFITLMKRSLEKFPNVDELISEDNEKIRFIESKRKDSRSLWKAILQTETESLPSIKAKYFYEKEGVHYLKCDEQEENTILERFDSEAIVDVIGKNPKSGNDLLIGRLNIGESNPTNLCFKKEPKNNWILDHNSTLYLQSRENKVSLKRRKVALSRILDNESVIEGLPEYFDESCNIAPIEFKINVSEEDFQRYERENDKGEIVGLNQAQKNAFIRLLNFGPLSLLQGPPGTGKTEFIAAFVHHLFEKQSVKNILLVSQSHEAVNTAAERIRRHCERLETPIDLVRFSNRESSISIDLQDVFSKNRVIAKREQLQAKQLQRIIKLGEALGLPEDYLNKRAKLQFDIGDKIDRYQRLQKDLLSCDTEDKKTYSKICSEIEKSIYQILVNDFTYLKDEKINNILPIIIDTLDKRYDISNKQSRQTGDLIRLTQDMQKALSNERVSYEEFLARSCQLVVGTCVGMGQGHLGINNIVYDWVIIDEAARSISSELAIAMQSGKRILLVGDHKQLPPLYSAEHKVALACRLGILARGEELDIILGSDFERAFVSAYGKQASAVLQTQYRMAPAIGTLVSDCFYDGELQNGKQQSDIPDIYGQLGKHFRSTVTWLDTAQLPRSNHAKLKNGSLTNEAEANLIIQLLQEIENNEDFCNTELVKDCLGKGEAVIGVICMYGEQKRLIQKKFNQKVWSDSFKQIVKIDTVDSYQGKENRIIILSITRNNNEMSPGFLESPNRINVALSRAMDRLIIVGATKMWQGKNNHYPFGKVLNFMQENKNQDDYNILLASNEVNSAAKKGGL